MNLTLDIGNSRIKTGIFDPDQLLAVRAFGRHETAKLISFASRYNITSCIISSVATIPQEIIRFLNTENINWFELSETTLLPVNNLYQSKATLGYDRIAAAIGANALFPDEPLLVIDFGTAITIDFVGDQNDYQGGNISPGLQTRFEALHEKTHKLPLLKPDEQVHDLISKDTNKAIINGVQNGIIFEIYQYIERLKTRHQSIRIIITGGDAHFFEKRLKNTIFVNHLILSGLNRILSYNVK